MLFGEFENARMWKCLIGTREATLLPCGAISSTALKLLALLVCVTIKCLLSIVLYVPVYTLVHWRKQRKIKYWKHWDFPHCPVRLGLCAFTAEAWVQSLVGELRKIPELCSVAKKKNKKKLKWQEYTEELYQKDLNDLDNHDGNAKKCSNYCTIALISHDSKVMLKILQASLQQCVNLELSDVQARFRKGRGTRDQIANICWIIEKAREF